MRFYKNWLDNFFGLNFNNVLINFLENINKTS